MSAPPSPSTAPSRFGAAIRRVVFLGVGMAVALCAVEATLRVFRLAPAQGVSTVTAKEYERVPGIYSPNQHVRDLQRPDLPYTVTIDSLGFRGPDFARAKPFNQLRVLMIGDSYVYGDFVEDAETLPAQLEARLRSVCHDALVINAGLGGSTIVDQAFMLERAMPLAPDVVILVYVGDDFQNLADPQPEWQQLAENRLKKSRFPLSVVYPLLHNTALWNLALKARARRVNQSAATSLGQAYARDSAETIGRLRDRYGEALVRLRDTLKARGIPFIFAMFPAWRELERPSDNLIWIGRFADTHAVYGASVLRALQASHAAATTLYLMPKDGHPGPVGYATAAADLAERVLHDAVVPPSCTR